MIIGVNIENLYPGKIGGAEQYVRNLINAMGKIEEIELAVFVNNIAFSSFQDSESIKIYEIDNKTDKEAQLNFYIDYMKIDIMFCPLFFLAPENCSIPSVVSILDVQHEFFPQYFSKKVLSEIKKSTRSTLDKATSIITISQFSKDTIIDKYNIPADKIAVTYLSADGCFDSDINQDSLKKINNSIASNYIFYPANTWPHKNHITLLKSYSILKEKYGTNLKLVFTGDGKQQKESIEKYINDSNLKNDIIYLGYVDQKDMPSVFANATIMVFPSLFEGFGIPLVEAMKSGVAIACSSCGSIPEVVDDCALIFDPYNTEDIAEKLNILENDKELRAMLISKGKERTKIFSWKKCALETVECLKKVYNDNKIDVESTYEELPLVSIITPSYNQGEFIKETIESVLNQDYPNIEYLVIDGGSTDQTVDILKSYGNRITWVSEKDEGQADAVNKGISAAHGSIIGWLNSDDTYLEGAISIMVKYFKNHPTTDMVYGEGYYIDKSSNIIERYLTEKFSRSRLAEQCIICQPTAFFTKKFVEEVGMLDKSLQLCMDYELWIRMAQKGKVAYIPVYIATSRMYEENKTLSRRDEVYSEICATVKKYYGFVPISWIQGYADFICKGNRGKKFKFNFIRLFIKYNIINYTYFKKCVRMILKGRFRPHIVAKEKKENFEGKYEDNWLSKLYKFDYETENITKGILIEGRHLWPYKNSACMRIVIDNIFIDEIVIKEKGEFNKKLELNTPIIPGKHEITLIMNKTFCPSKKRINNDNRELSIQLFKFDLVGEEHI